MSNLLVSFTDICLTTMLENSFDITKTEAGVDEAGRGCYAGPVVAAAVILPKDFHHRFLNDSKKLSEKQREELRPIIEKEAICFAVGFINNEEIDKINILQATYKAMHQSINKLNVQPELLLIDGNRFKPFPGIPHQCIIKGDGKYASIAAASILAKTYRDEIMNNLHLEFPDYGWEKNKGYGTLEHRSAIEKFGLCSYHRKSYNILPAGQNLFK
jgi:ribonuclease HII